MKVSEKSLIQPPKTKSKEEEDYLKYYADLEADDYIHYRLEDQFTWYRGKAKAYDHDYQILQTSVYVFGGLGTLLAAIGLQNLVAVSTALAAALASYLEYKRVEATLVGYNQAADALYDIRAWWYSLSNDDKGKFANFEKLVTSTEETIRSEHTSWLQDMQDRLANLYGDQADEASDQGSETQVVSTQHSEVKTATVTKTDTMIIAPAETTPPSDSETEASSQEGRS